MSVAIVGVEARRARMESDHMAKVNREIREIRTPFTGAFTYVSGCGDAGRATWLNISRTGAAVRLGRYLRPGHVVQLHPASVDQDASWSIPARVVWCTRIPGTFQFQAGLAVDRSCPEATLHFATLGYAARALNTNTDSAVVTAGWSPDAAAPALSPTGLASLVQAV
jgi:hypothetical protein